MINDTSYFLSMALQDGNNLLSVLVKDNSILVITTWTQLQKLSTEILSHQYSWKTIILNEAVWIKKHRKKQTENI